MDLGRTHGFIDLAFDLVEEVTDLVERTHDATLGRSVERCVPDGGPAGNTAKVVAGIQRTVSAGVFGSIRAINAVTRFAVNTATDIGVLGLERESDSSGFDRPTFTSAALRSSTERYLDQVQSSLNGFWGDALSRSDSRLDLGMGLRHQGRVIPVTRQDFAAAYPDPTNRICVFVHGLAATEGLWSLASEEHYGRPGVTFGSRLRDDLGITPIYLRYNTGRHISENGCALAALLTEFLRAYPVPVEEIALVGHSMGGLVARSAVHYGREREEPWVARLRHVACIGSPHLGAPLEKAVNLLTVLLRNVSAAGAQVPAELLDSRSAGVKDLRHGYTLDEEWVETDPNEGFTDGRVDVPPMDGVGYYFLASTVSRDVGHPLGQLLGDLMVPLASASGKALDPARSIDFSGGAVLGGMNHLDLVSHPDVYEVLRDWLR